MVKNHIESLVNDVLKNELVDHPDQYRDICLSPPCIMRIKTTALNLLKPFYVTCIAGEVYGEYHGKDSQNLSDVAVAVAKGIEELLAYKKAREQ